VIEIHLDGKPVTKLQAARAVALVNGQSVDVGEPNASGWIEHGITVYHRHRTLDGDQPAQVHWASYTGVSAADARMFAEMITLGAEVAELAEMIAAEQDATEPTDEPGCGEQHHVTGLECTSHRDGWHVTRRPEWPSPEIRWPIEPVSVAERARAGAAKSGFKPVAGA
jgi:hypothetical protein